MTMLSLPIQDPAARHKMMSVTGTQLVNKFKDHSPYQIRRNIQSRKTTQNLNQAIMDSDSQMINLKYSNLSNSQHSKFKAKDETESP